MRLAFLGTPQLAVPALEALQAEHEICIVVTRPDKPAGRGGHLHEPPVKRYATEAGLPVVQPEKARDGELEQCLHAARPDLMVVVAYGRILPREVLAVPPAGAINLHYSLLPRWRGAAPVQHAILAGDAITGLTTQWIVEELDAGDIILQQEFALGEDETAGELLERLSQPGADLLARTVGAIAEGSAGRQPQDTSQVTLAPPLRREDSYLDWTRDALTLHRQVRAMNPWPGARGRTGEDELLIWQSWCKETDTDGVAGTVEVIGEEVLIQCKPGRLGLKEVQSPGRKRLSAPAWARGVRPAPPHRLT